MTVQWACFKIQGQAGDKCKAYRGGRLCKKWGWGGRGTEAVLLVLAVLLSSSLSQCTVLCCGGPDGLFELGGHLLLENETKTPTSPSEG